MVSAASSVNTINSTTNTSIVSDSSNVDQQDFLKLLIAQLQNQDPLNPVENQEFVAQLATFSSLEQQQMQTSLLKDLIAAQNTNTSTQALSLIGKEASVIIDQFSLQSSQEIDFTFLTGQTGTEAVRIFDANGDLVRSDVINVSRTGEIPYHFDGKNNQGENLPAGDYSISIGETMDEDGNVTSYPTFIRGLVEGVTFLDGTPILVVDGNAVPYDEVYGVYERSTIQ